MFFAHVRARHRWIIEQAIKRELDRIDAGFYPEVFEDRGDGDCVIVVAQPNDRWTSVVQRLGAPRKSA